MGRREQFAVEHLSVGRCVSVKPWTVPTGYPSLLGNGDQNTALLGQSIGSLPAGKKAASPRKDPKGGAQQAEPSKRFEGKALSEHAKPAHPMAMFPSFLLAGLEVPLFPLILSGP